MASNPRKAGAPKKTVQLNMNNINDSKREILNICSNLNTQNAVIQLLDEVQAELIHKHNAGTQTSIITSSVESQTEPGPETPGAAHDTPPESDISTVFKQIEKFAKHDDYEYLLHNSFNKCENKVQQLMLMLFSLEEDDEQVEFFKMLGDEFNEYVWKESKTNQDTNISFVELMKI